MKYMEYKDTIYISITLITIESISSSNERYQINVILYICIIYKYQETETIVI